MESAVQCPQCHVQNLPDANFCQVCGAILKPTLVTAEMTCPFCGKVVDPSFVVCPNCGKTLREKPLSSTTWKQVGIYLTSALLPPLGLWPGFKYLGQKEAKLKRIGIVAIVLTIVSTILTIYYTIQITNQVNVELNKQLQDINF